MREKEENTKIIFVRHGKTDFPEKRLYCDDIEDPELNATGKGQIKGISRFLEKKEIHTVYTSPANRTRMTAEEIVRITNAPLLESKALQERHFGILQGLFFSEIEKKHTLEFKNWKENPAGFKPEGGESIYDLLKRIKDKINEIVFQYPGKTIVIVTHVGPIRMAIVDALKIPVELYRQICIDHASLTRIDYGKSQNNFAYMNVIPNTIED